jgi:hypothetical protein
LGVVVYLAAFAALAPPAKGGSRVFDLVFGVVLMLVVYGLSRLGRRWLGVDVWSERSGGSRVAPRSPSGR